MLDHRLVGGQVDSSELDRLAAMLLAFYRRAARVLMLPAAHLAQWQQGLLCNRRVLLDPRLGLPAGLVRRIDPTTLSRLPPGCSRASGGEGRVVDGHGDLRPEHVWLGDQIKIVDCLEFNANLRAVDPFDEMAYLSLECERLGARRTGEDLRRRLAHG